MNTADIENMHRFVDENLEIVRKTHFMWSPRETSIDSWMSQKPADSSVSDDDIQDLEQHNSVKYPKLYALFLKYKHFFELWPVAEINFFTHDTNKWKENLIKCYHKSWIPEKLIGQSYIYFADYSDWGIVCFDTTQQNIEDLDCPIIMIDHECLHNDIVPKETLYPSFAEMIRSLLEEQKNLDLFEQS